MPPSVGSVWARLHFCEPEPHDLVQVVQAPKPLVTQSVAARVVVAGGATGAR